MKKLMTLVIVAGFAIAANANAADAETRAAQAKDRAERAAARAKARGDKPDIVELGKDGKTAVDPKTGRGVTTAKNSVVAWAKAHPKTAIAAGAGTAVVAGLAIDAAVRKQNSLLGKLIAKTRKQARTEVLAN